MNVNAVFRKVGFHNIEIFKICLIFSENFSYLQEQISIFLITKANESFNFCRYLSLTETLGNCIYQSLFTKKKYNQIVTNLCVCVCVCMCGYSGAQSCPTLCKPMDCSLPGSSVHGVFQAKILEWVAISYSKEFSHICTMLNKYRYIYST